MRARGRPRPARCRRSGPAAPTPTEVQPSRYASHLASPTTVPKLARPAARCTGSKVRTSGTAHRTSPPGASPVAAAPRPTDDGIVSELARTYEALVLDWDGSAVQD